MGNDNVPCMAEKKKPAKKTVAKKAAPKKAAAKKAATKKVPAKKTAQKKAPAVKKAAAKTSATPSVTEFKFEVSSDFSFDEVAETVMGELITANDIKTSKTRKKFLSWFKR
jgi:hypothetical protein